MENFRTVFFPKSHKGTEEFRCRTRNFVVDADSRYDRYKRNTAAADADRQTNEKTSDRNS